MAARSRVIAEAGIVVEPDGHVRKDAAILIDDGVVTAIESRASLVQLEADERIGGPDYFALPGLVDAHQHGRADSTAALGVCDAPLECWLVDLFASAVEDTYARTLRLCRQLLSAGITTAVHMHSSFASSVDAYDMELRALLEGYRDGGVRVVLAAALRDRGVPVYGDTAAFLARLPPDIRAEAEDLLPPLLPTAAALEAIDGIRSDTSGGRYGEAALAYGPAGPPWCSDQLLTEVARRSRAERSLVHTHLLETRYERAFGRGASGTGAVADLERLGLLHDGLFVAHGVWLDAQDRSTLARLGVSVVTNPSSNLRLHAGVAEVREMLEAGINVALGTDNMTLEGEDDLLEDARLLRALDRRADVHDRGIGVRSLLAMASQNGGRALQRPDVGVLRPGAAGDVVLLELASAQHSPLLHADPLELLLATARRDDIRFVVASGRLVVRDGVPTTPGPIRAVTWPSERMHAFVQRLAPFIRDHYAMLIEKNVGRSFPDVGYHVRSMTRPTTTAAVRVRACPPSAGSARAGRPPGDASRSRL